MSGVMSKDADPENMHGERESQTAQSLDTNEEEIREAQDATDQEHELTFWKAVRKYPKAIGWSVLLSTAVVMEGYDLLLMGNLYGTVPVQRNASHLSLTHVAAQPAFQQRYGRQLSNDTFQIPAPWQAGLSNGATVGAIIGLFVNGYISERYGFKKTMITALCAITAIIFIPFFATSLEVLLVGQILIGIPWGIFQTLTTAYAAEVVPLHLRAYLTTYVNLCWVSLQNTNWDRERS